MSGDLLIIIAQIISAIQFVYEEKFIKKYHFQPLLVVGLEGLTYVLRTYLLMLPASIAVQVIFSGRVSFLLSLCLYVPCAPLVLFFDFAVCLGIQYGRHQKFKLVILLNSLTPKMWG